MPSIKFTAAKIKFVEGVRGKQVDYFDKTLSSFFMRVSQDGKKSFGVMYRKGGRLRRMNPNHRPHAAPVINSARNSEGTGHGHRLEPRQFHCYTATTRY